MSDYISRKDAKNYVIGRYDDQLGFITMEDIIDQLDYVPAADVRPVVVARLEYRHTKNGDGLFCTNCGELWTARKIGKYCYNCGADMREKIDHD